MQLPSEFKCAGNTIKVKLVEKTDNDNYGNQCDVTNTITIAKTIELEDKYSKADRRSNNQYILA